MKHVKPTRTSEHSSMVKQHVNAVGKHRLGDGTHSHVFPEHADTNHWHKGHRNGHLGTHTVHSGGRK